MSTITTHVLDIALGKPAAGVGVRLEVQVGGGWMEVTHHEGKEPPWTERVEDVPGSWSEVARSVTDADGRCRDLAPIAPGGVYRLIFDTGNYMRGMQRASIYPEVAITFACKEHEHYHLPLLLSDNGYTTYRGS